MDKQDKPRICEVLGGKDNPLRIGETFTIKGYPNRDYRDVILHRDGKLHNYLGEPCQSTGTRVGNKIGVNALYWIMDHPESIIRKPRFTEDEVADANFLHKALYAEWVARGLCEADLFVFESKPWFTDEGLCGVGTKINQDLFPSLRPGQISELAQIIGGDNR